MPLLASPLPIAGMAIGFPIGGGIAWILGIVFSFVLVIAQGGVNPGNSTLLFAGVAVIGVAILLTMRAYGQLASAIKKPSTNAVLLSVFAGLLIAFFYGLVVKSIDHAFVSGGSGKLMPLTGAFFFTVGAFVTTFLFNPFFMRRPVEGEPVSISDYWKGDWKTHLTGLLGGAIWSVGISSSFIAVGAAGPAVSYALSNAAPVVAILWGVLVWREFAAAPRGVGRVLATMFICYLIGLGLITYSRI
jgi:glucose uptake protein